MESSDKADVPAQVLADVFALKKTANDYMHSEVKVILIDPCSFERNLFRRSSPVIR